MSYGAYGKQAVRYREMEVLSATPGQMVVMVYDHLLVQLTRVRHALDRNQLDARSEALERSRAALSELLITLDPQRGGALASQLGAIYSFLLGELSVLGLKPEARRLERVTGIVSQLRDAFARAASEAEATAAV
jgi:flagellar protein FliS